MSAAETYAHVAGGKLKTLAVMSDQRIKGFEKAPTLKERGMDISIGTWRGLAVNKATPPDVVAMLRAATAKIVQEQSLRDALDMQNMGYAYAEGDAFGTVMAKDHAFYKTLIDKLGLKAQPSEAPGVTKPSILVCRAVDPKVIARLEQHFDVRSNQGDEPWSREQLIAALAGRQGLFATGGERIDAALLQACPSCASAPTCPSASTTSTSRP